MRTLAAVVVATVLFACADCNGNGSGNGVGEVESGAGASQVANTEVIRASAASATNPLSSRLSAPQFNFLVGVAQVGALHENGTHCGRELEKLLKAVERKELWSMKVLDSFGTPPKSFSWGNYHWFSPQRLCNDLNTPLVVAISTRSLSTYSINPFNITSPFPLRFTMIYMRFSTPHFIDVRMPFESIIHIGLCLPQSCSVSTLQRYTDEYFQRGEFVTQRNFDLQLESVAARAPSFGSEFFQQTGMVITIAILTTLFALYGLAEIVHRSKQKLKQQKLRHTKAPIAPIVTTTFAGVHIANVSVVAMDTTTTTTATDMKASESSTILEEIILCFRLSDNWRRALQPERCNSNSNFLGAIAGVRTIICLWVSTFHVYYYSVFALSNFPLMFAVLANFANQPILQAIFFVDIFFVMSALLLVYNFLSTEARLKEIRQNDMLQNLKLFGMLVLHRYLRLTPMVLVTVVLSDVMYDFLNTYTPFYLGINSGFYCKQRWWHNLLYIQNFLDMKDICCSWTWYLACEMQFYILITALLFLYAKNEDLTKIAFVVLTIAFATIGWICNYENGITFDIDVIHSTMNELYVKPWVRINPYLGGAFCGWLLHHHDQRRQQRYHNHHEKQQQQQQQSQQQPHTQSETRPHAAMHGQQQQQNEETTAAAKTTPPTATAMTATAMKTTANGATTTKTTTTTKTPTLAIVDRHCKIGYGWCVAFWLFTAFVYVLANFMSYWRTTPTWLVATIMSFGKLLFALTIGGGILMCARGHGGRLNGLLSARPFRLLNKFCFSIYLLMPLITFAGYGLRHEPTNFNEIASGADFIAMNVLGILCAFIAYVMVELPLLRVCNRLVNKRS